MNDNNSDINHQLIMCFSGIVAGRG